MQIYREERLRFVMDDWKTASVVTEWLEKDIMIKKILTVSLVEPSDADSYFYVTILRKMD